MNGRLAFNYKNYMEENTKDSCCANGKCLCHKKWARTGLLVAGILVIFLMGTIFGSCCGYQKRGHNFRGGNEQFGQMNNSCPMMGGQGMNRGMNNNCNCPMMGGQGMAGQGKGGCQMNAPESNNDSQKTPSTIKIQLAPSASTSTTNK